MPAVARIEHITDPADARLADYISLRDVELRTSVEAEHGLFLAEGEKVVRRAVESGFAVRSFLMAPRWMDPLADVLDLAGDAPCYVAPAELIESVTGFHVHRGALASLRRLPLPTVSEVVATASRVVVLEDLVDHANVGAVFRAGGGAGNGCCAVEPAMRRPALPPRGQGVHGRRVLGPLHPDDAVVRRAGRAAPGRFPSSSR